MTATASARRTALLRRLDDSRLYLCTDARRERGDLAAFADAVLSAGVDIIQLRDKGSAGEREYGALTALEELDALAVLREAATKHDALLSVNDRADFAVTADADVLHLGQDDLPVAAARKITGDDMIFGRSTHSDAQADAAAAEAGVDYFSTGPLWPTPTKPGRPSTGLEILTHTRQSGTPRPWFAIGGINAQTLPEVLAAGASRVVVVRAITHADDPAAATRALKAALARAGQR